MGAKEKACRERAATVGPATAAACSRSLPAVGVIAGAVSLALVARVFAVLAAVLAVGAIWCHVALTAGMCAFHSDTS